jgi:FkbM family methyltransferase
MTLKRFVRRLLWPFGYDIVQPRWLYEEAFIHNLETLFPRYGITCVIDAGANNGQYRDFLRTKVKYTGWILSFEPQPECVAAMRALASTDDRWAIFDFALGDVDGSAPLHIMQDRDHSSFLQPNRTTGGALAAADTIARTESVPVRRLDQLLPGLRQQYPMDRTFLKLDTQGFDLQVLAGTGSALAQIVGVQAALLFQSLYVGMPSATDTLARLHSQHFDVSGIFQLTSDDHLRVVKGYGVLINSRLIEATA